MPPHYEAAYSAVGRVKSLRHDATADCACSAQNSGAQQSKRSRLGNRRRRGNLVHVNVHGLGDVAPLRRIQSRHFLQIQEAALRGVDVVAFAQLERNPGVIEVEDSEEKSRFVQDVVVAIELIDAQKAGDAL